MEKTLLIGKKMCGVKMRNESANFYKLPKNEISNPCEKCGIGTKDIYTLCIKCGYRKKYTRENNKIYSNDAKLIYEIRKERLKNSLGD